MHLSAKISCVFSFPTPQKNRPTPARAGGARQRKSVVPAHQALAESPPSALGSVLVGINISRKRFSDAFASLQMLESDVRH